VSEKKEIRMADRCPGGRKPPSSTRRAPYYDTTMVMGACPVCGKECRLTLDGSVYPHNAGRHVSLSEQDMMDRLRPLLSGYRDHQGWPGLEEADEGTGLLIQLLRLRGVPV
jgi:hypothetical protein